MGLGTGGGCLGGHSAATHPAASAGAQRGVDPEQVASASPFLPFDQVAGWLCQWGVGGRSCPSREDPATQ